MALDERGAIEVAAMLRSQQDSERMQLDVMRRYSTGKQALPLVIPRDAPSEVRELARISRINLIKIVIDALVDSLHVDGFRVSRAPATPEIEEGGEPLALPAATEADDVQHEVWAAWQGNRMDARQSGLYRATMTYGYGYMVVTAGTPYPVMRPMSPRKMTVMYDDAADDWPVYAIERRRSGLRGTERFRLYDEGQVYDLGYDIENKRFGLIGDPQRHGSPYCPVIRYLDAEDLDADDEPEPELIRGARGRDLADVTMVAGQVAPLMAMQDQTDVSSLELHSAQWYAAFRQRWVVGWTPGSPADKVKSAASQLWTFDADPDEVKLGEFAETNLTGLIDVRERGLKYAATLSQTPVHELIGELVNLSAEALAAAEAGRDRKVGERKTGFGESHEQMAQCVGDLMGVDVPDDFETVWRDSSARAFGAVVDGLGKLAAQLGIPPAELWDRIPGVTQQDVRRWKAKQAEGDALASLTGLLDRQANPEDPDTGATGGSGGLILPPERRARA